MKIKESGLQMSQISAWAVVSGVKYTKGKTSIEHGYAKQKGWYTQRPTYQESAQHNVKGEQATEGGDEEHEICISAIRDPIGEWLAKCLEQNLFPGVGSLSPWPNLECLHSSEDIR